MADQLAVEFADWRESQVPKAFRERGRFAIDFHRVDAADFRIPVRLSRIALVIVRLRLVAAGPGSRLLLELRSAPSFNTNALFCLTLATIGGIVLKPSISLWILLYAVLVGFSVLNELYMRTQYAWIETGIREVIDRVKEEGEAHAVV